MVKNGTYEGSLELEMLGEFVKARFSARNERFFNAELNSFARSDLFFKMHKCVWDLGRFVCDIFKVFGKFKYISILKISGSLQRI